jgi:hypothetical protein
MLLYLVKHSRPDIANTVRELSKVADGATEAHWKALLRCIKYVMEDNLEGFNLEGISDSEYAGDPETRISVYGYVLYFCGAPISWKSKAGKSVTLSSTEAEYYATSEVAKEVLFAKQILEAIGIEIKYPIIIKCDNVGAIYLANNHSMSQRTKHIDTRRHFVREFVEDGILKVVFVPTKQNEADIFTKNVTEEIFNTHVPKLMSDVKKPAKEQLHTAYIMKETTMRGFDYCVEGGDFIKTIKRESNPCYMCGQMGHKADDCWGRPRLDKKEPPGPNVRKKVLRNKVHNGPDLIHINKVRPALPIATSVSLKPYTPRPIYPKETRKKANEKNKGMKMSSQEFNNRMTEIFNPKQWRSEIHNYSRGTAIAYPTHKYIEDKKQVKYNTYHCNGWTTKVRNPKGRKKANRKKRRNNGNNRKTLPVPELITAKD